MRLARVILVCCLSHPGIMAQVEPPAESPVDPFLTMARQSAVAFGEKLPNFVCRQLTTRYRRNLSDGSWQQLDIISVDVAYNRKTGESYSNLQVNGAPAGNQMLALSGSSSVGEFALDLPNLFASASDDDFHINEDVVLNGLPARVYAYEVGQSASRWNIKERDIVVTPGYAGRIWIDKKLSRAIRLEMIADSLPPTLHADQITTTIDFGPVDLGDGNTYFLPTGSETTFCKRDSGACDRNTTELRNYRKFGAESNIAFGEIPKEFGLSSATPTPAPSSASSRGKRGSSKEPLFSFVGVVRPPQDKSMILELDDTRFILFTAGGAAPIGLSPGDRIHIESDDYDSRGLLARSFSVVQAAPVAAPSLAEPTIAATPPDPIVEQARESAKTLVLALPNFLCNEEVRRYRNWPKHKQWQFEDTLSAELLYSRKNGEDYRNIRINGEPTKKHWLELGGDVSTGEFGSLLQGVLSKRGGGFKFEAEDTVDNTPARRYSFHVSHEESDWTIMSEYQFIVPAYSGKLWFDRDSNAVLRVERHAEDIPTAFPISSVDTEVNFGLVHLGSSETYVLPVRAETRACYREKQECSRKTIDFRNYKKFTGESKIIF
ncbi:MAG: hypothetical protein WBW33_23235 [Bryobacteraceae bacterium]